MTYCLTTISDDSTVQYTKNLISSFLDKNSWFEGDIIVFYHKLLENNKKHLIKEKVFLKEVNIEQYKEIFEKFGENIEFFKYEIMELENYDRVVYIDSKNIVLKDIKELFDTNFPLAVESDNKKNSTLIFKYRNQWDKFKTEILSISKLYIKKKWKEQLIKNSLINVKPWQSSVDETFNRFFNRINYVLINYDFFTDTIDLSDKTYIVKSKNIISQEYINIKLPDTILTKKKNQLEIINDKRTIKKLSDKERDINLIISVKGREKQLITTVNHLIEQSKKTKLKIQITVVEMDSESKNNLPQVDYIFLPIDACDSYNYNSTSLAYNVGYTLCKESKWYNFVCSDLVYSSNLFEEMKKNLTDEVKWMQCFSGQSVMYLDEESTEKVYSGEKDFKTLNYHKSEIGAPGGNIIVRKDIFEKVGGYEHEFFWGWSPEDCMFWLKLECLSKKIERHEIINPHLGGAKYLNIIAYHLIHETIRDFPYSDNMLNIYESFRLSSYADKLKYIENKSVKFLDEIDRVKNKKTKMNPFDFFEEIYCINLDERKDRWEEVQKEFESVGILDRVKRFSAIKHLDGRIGCIKSHLEILKIARDRNLNNILILEDDVHFINNPLEILPLSVEQIKKLKWTLLYLGANTHTKLFKTKPNLLELKKAFSTHALCYNRICYNKIIEELSQINEIRKMDDILDVYMSEKIQEKYLCLLINPLIATQRTSYSDIEKKICDYSFIEERFKQNT